MLGLHVPWLVVFRLGFGSWLLGFGNLGIVFLLFALGLLLVFWWVGGVCVCLLVCVILVLFCCGLAFCVLGVGIMLDVVCVCVVWFVGVSIPVWFVGVFAGVCIWFCGCLILGFWCSGVYLFPGSVLVFCVALLLFGCFV